MAWPAPFIRRTDFLPPEVHARVVQLAIEALPRFKASTVNYRPGGAVAKRRSWMLDEANGVSALFKLRLKALMRTFPDSHWLYAPFSGPPRYEIQVTCHGDGGLFEPHADYDEILSPERRITFVYYFHAQPKRFSGGDLRIFDGARAGRRFSHDQFTCIPPTDNSLVLFPSTAVHEVRPVESPGDDLAGGRFTVNGWLLG